MALSNDKLIMIFGFDNEEQKEIKDIITANQLPTQKIIEDNMNNMKIKDIIQGFNIPTENTIKQKEKVILFNNLDDMELEKSITVFREQFQNIIFAVTTPTSIEWTFEKLLSDLIAEKRWVESRKKNK